MYINKTLKEHFHKTPTNRVNENYTVDNGKIKSNAIPDKKSYDNIEIMFGGNRESSTIIFNLFVYGSYPTKRDIDILVENKVFTVADEALFLSHYNLG